MEQGASNHTVAGMKGSPGTELCCLLGADGGIGIFRGKKGAALCGRAAIMLLKKNTKRRKRKKPRKTFPSPEN
jgi:hypothetical protein